MPIQKWKAIQELLEGNRHWAETRKTHDPGFFERLAAGQAPQFLYIGCADSRVPPDGITGSDPGRLFVARNIANQVRPDDDGLASVVEYAIDVLGVEHVIVCGHTGCGGVKAALSEGPLRGALSSWLAPLRALVRASEAELRPLDDKQRWNRMVERNVETQVHALTRFEPIAEAWRAGREVVLHGWVFDVEAGRVKDLMTLTGDTIEAAQ